MSRSRGVKVDATIPEPPASDLCSLGWDHQGVVAAAITPQGYSYSAMSNRQNLPHRSPGSNPITELFGNVVALAAICILCRIAASLGIGEIPKTQAHSWI
jgi:hypothetical protein